MTMILGNLLLFLTKHLNINIKRFYNIYIIVIIQYIYNTYIKSNPQKDK